MDQIEVSSSGGKARVYIKAASDLKINNKQYKKGEIIAYFPRTSFELYFENKGKSSETNKIIQSNYDLNLRSIIIRPHGFSSSIFDLITLKTSKNKVLVPILEKIETDSEGGVFLKNPVASDLVIKQNGEKVEDFTLVDGTEITGLAADSSYLAQFYKEVQSSGSYDVKSRYLSYFKIEIINSVNLNENSQSNMLITAPRVSLSSSPILDYRSEEITRIELEFNVIDGKAQVDFY